MDVINPLQPGRVVTADTINENSSVQRSHLLGRTGVIDDMDRSGSSTRINRVSGMDVHVTLVQNDSGGTLAPGLAVAWKSGGTGTTIGGLAGAGDDAAGIVDPFITGTVPDKAYFYVVTYGPTKVISSAAISIDAELACAADGKMVTGNGKGKALVAAAGADETIRAFVDFREVSSPA